MAHEGVAALVRLLSPLRVVVFAVSSAHHQRTQLTTERLKALLSGKLRQHCAYITSLSLKPYRPPCPHANGCGDASWSNGEVQPTTMRIQRAKRVPVRTSVASLRFVRKAVSTLMERQYHRCKCNRASALAATNVSDP